MITEKCFDDKQPVKKLNPLKTKNVNLLFIASARVIPNIL